MRPASEGQPARLSSIVAMGWGLGTLPMAIYFNSFNILALRFFTDFVGLAAGTAGLLIGLSKIYDAATDPLMGMLSDATRARLGGRRLYILLGGFLCACSIFLLFSIPPGLHPDIAFWTVLAAVLLYATSYTVYNVPYMAMPSEITEDPESRSRMITWRVFCIGVGGIVAGFLGPQVIELSGGGTAGHSVMGAVLGVLILGFSWLCYYLTRSAPVLVTTIKARRFTLRDTVSIFVSNRPYVTLLGLKFFNLAGVAVSAGTLSFFTVWVLEESYSTLGTIILVTSLGQMAGAPLWLRFSLKFGRRASYMLSASLFILASMSWLLADASEPLFITLARVFFKGLATGGILLVGQVLLPDTIEYDRLANRQRREGVLSGLYTTTEKLAFAFGTAFTGIYLGSAGYISLLKPGVDTQGAEAIRAIYYCQSVLPGTLLALSALVMWFYKLDSQKLSGMRSELVGQS